jgi:predicted ATPase/class 3 adenylate cyclase
MPDLPTGTVAFLFTDIEGSTSRWDRAPKAMALAVARHDALLNACIVDNGGSVFKTVGDAFCAVFPTAPSAIVAALAIDHSLAGETWDEIDGLRLRIAVHAGEAEERDADYFGPAVNRVARLLSAGYGGQILLSGPAAELARDSLPSEATLRDLGEHRLKDLTRPEHVYQLVAPGLRTEFPPLKTLDRHPHNLPEQTTPFIGREADVTTARGFLERDDVRLLTLTGPGGVGKTRLSLQVAAELVESFADGVWFVPLAPLGHSDLVIPAIAQALGVRQIGELPLIESLIGEMQSKQFLLVLDNFEHLTAGASAIGDLMAACAKLKVLITSRVVLHLYGERELAIPPLEVPDINRLPMIEDLASIESVRLFVERAHAANAGFSLSEANASAVAAICVRLDGLPLAIELAAARIRMLPPPSILARLEHRLQLLTGGGVDRDPRQQTLRGAIAWSYDLLDDGEQRLFRRLSVFAGGCTLEAAEAVANGAADLEVDVFDGVASLVEKSLLRVEGRDSSEPRFAMLESIRAFGADALETSGEAHSLRQLHAAHFLSVAEEAEPHLSGPEQVARLDLLEQEQGNLDAALRWLHGQSQVGLGLRLAGALWQFWSLRGHFSVGRDHLDALLGLPGSDQDREVRAKALNAAGVLAESQGDFLRATELHEESLVIARETGDTREATWALANLGCAALGQGDLDRAQETLEAALAAARESGFKQYAAASLVDLGRVALGRSDVKEAADLYQDGLALFREIGDETQISRTLNNLGEIAIGEGDFDRATTLFQESLACFKEIGDKRSIAGTLNNLAEVARHQGNYADAENLYAESQQLAEDVGDKLLTAIAIENRAEVARSRDDPRTAGSLYKQAFSIYRVLPDWEGIVTCLHGLAHIALDRGQQELAVRLFSASAAFGHDHGLQPGSALEEDDPARSSLVGVRSSLGQQAFETLWEGAGRMSLEEASREADLLQISTSRTPPEPERAVHASAPTESISKFSS